MAIRYTEEIRPDAVRNATTNGLTGGRYPDLRLLSDNRLLALKRKSYD